MSEKENRIIINGDVNPTNNMHPRSINAEYQAEIDLDRTGNTFSGNTRTGNNGNSNISDMLGTAGMNSGSPNIVRNPSRRYYDPEVTTTAIYLPKDLKTKNRWNRWYFAHDELIGTVLEMHAELPYSRASLMLDDHVIKREFEDCLEDIKFFSELPRIDLEYLKTGEVFINTPWDKTKGRWSHIICQNPDFVDVRFSPFADEEAIIEIIPDDELKKIVHSTKPEDQAIKKRIPADILKRVLSGRNIILNSDEVTHIARKLNPYDTRGTSIISRLYRTLMYEDKLRESQITISDNFIYPLKVFKLGDQNRGWIPNESHQRALAGMLQQASFDPNFSLIYHYGLQIEYHTVADKLMRLDQEWSEINSRKLIALGVSEQFIKGDSSFSCFVEGTLVNTPKGFAPIESIKNNDIVLDKEGIPQVVTNNWDEGIPKKLVKINLWGGKSFECTETHKWPVWSWPRTCLCGCGKTVRPGKSYAHKGAQLEASKKNIKFLDCGRHTLSGKMLMPVHGDYEPINTYEAKDIQHQDYLMIPRKFKEIKPNVTLDHARLLGYWVAEGNFSKNSRTKEKAGLNLTFNINEEHTWYKDSTEILEAIGIPLTKTEYRNSSIRIRTSNLIDHRDKIKWFFDNGGEYSYGKTLSPEVMSWPLEYKMEFIKGLFRGDGTHSSKSIKGGSHQHLVSYVTVSKTLAEQVELILAQLGFPCNWTLVDQSKTKSKGNRMCYRLTIYGKFCFELAKLVWGDACKIKESTFRGQKAFVDDNYVYLMVRSTELLDNTENKKVFNLTVDGTHSYLVHSVGTFNSASVGLQTQLSRYKAKRDLFEIRWVRDKLFRVMAERNEWYYRDKREIANNFRVTRSSSELKDRLMIPKLVWEKKLMLRDDQAHLTFLSNVFAQGKGPISAETLLQSMGLDIEEELRKKKAQKQLEQKVGEYVMPPAPGAPGAGGAPGGAPGGLPGLSPPSPSSAGGAPVGAAVAGSSTAPMAPGAKAFIDKAKELFRFGKKEVEVKTAQNDYLNKIIASTLELPNDPFATPISDVSDEASLNNTRAGSILVGDTSATKYADKDVFISKEHSAELEFIRRIPIVPDDLWYKNITASVVPGEVGILMSLLDSKLKSYTKKYADFSQVTDSDFDSVSKLYEDIYLQGKILTYSKLGSIPVQYQIQSTVNADIRDYSDIIIFNNFKEWIDTYKNIDIPSKNKLSYLRSLGNSCFAIGQIKGFQEQGINNVRIGNVLAKEGLHFKADDLMDKGVYLSPYLTYTDEVILLNPCIEGYDYEESGNFVDDSIQRYKTFSENGLIIKDCPIEFTGYISSILNKTGSLFKSKYSTIQFVLDVVDTQEWKDQYLAIIEKEIQDPILSMQKLSLDLNYKRGKIATFIDGKTLFVSSWIGMEDTPFTDNFIKHSGIFDESIVKKVSKAFKVPSYDLSKDEMETYTMFNYLDPIVDDLKEVRGYKASSTYIAIPQKLRYGKTWSADGKCVNSMKESVYDVFSKNIRLYIDYPQFLDEDIIKSYNEVF